MDILLKQVDDVILTELIPAITGGINVNHNEMKLISLPVKYGGLGIPLFSEISNLEYDNSLLITENLRNKINDQIRQYEADPDLQKKKNKIKANKAERYKAILDDIKNAMNDQSVRLNTINREISASTWLTTLPLKG